MHGTYTYIKIKKKLYNSSHVLSRYFVQKWTSLQLSQLSQ